MTSGQRGPVDENGVDAISRHRRESAIEIRDAEHRNALDLKAKFPAGGFSGLQGKTPRRGGRGPDHAEPCRLRYRPFNIPIPFSVNSVCTTVNPVMFPPGRGRLATCPSPAGSAFVEKTIGIVLVACLARSVSVEEGAKIMSTFTRTNSAAASCSCSTVTARRNSMVRFLPSM